MTTPDGRVVKLPDGATEKQVRAIFAKFRNGEQPTPGGARDPAEDAAAERGGRGRWPAAAHRATTTSSAGATSCSSRRPTALAPRAVRTGLTDLDYSEVVSGLKAGDSVLVLPSASLINSQQEFKNRIQNMTGGGVPGMRQTTTPPAGGAARPAAPAGR